MGPGAVLMPLGTLKLAVLLAASGILSTHCTPQVFALLAPVFLGEPLEQRDVTGVSLPWFSPRGFCVGIIFIVTGSMATVWFGPRGSAGQGWSAAEMINHFADPAVTSFTGASSQLGRHSSDCTTQLGW